MRHAVVVAHPRAESLTGAIAAAYAEAVRGLGDEIELRDLYRMGFDPRLQASELPGPAAPVFHQDVLAERQLLAECDVYALFYPLWFNGPPAMIKGYIDRVFSTGFGYEPALHGTDPLLSGRRLISFTTSGAPEHWVRDTGAMSALTAIFDSHLAAICGLTVLDHVHLGGIVPGITLEAVQQILGDVRSAVSRVFAADPVS